MSSFPFQTSQQRLLCKQAKALTSKTKLEMRLPVAVRLLLQFRTRLLLLRHLEIPPVLRIKIRCQPCRSSSPLLPAIVLPTVPLAEATPVNPSAIEREGEDERNNLLALERERLQLERERFELQQDSNSQAAPV